MKWLELIPLVSDVWKRVTGLFDWSRKKVIGYQETREQRSISAMGRKSDVSTLQKLSKAIASVFYKLRSK